ncbi:hypothetical protein BC826DRAFT_1175495, partial [Russula brevipes]
MRPCWTCADAVQHMYDQGGAAIAQGAMTPPNHLFARTICPGRATPGSAPPAAPRLIPSRA